MGYSPMLEAVKAVLVKKFCGYKPQNFSAKVSVTVITIYFSSIKTSIYQQIDRRKLSGKQNDSHRRFLAERRILSRFRSGSGSILAGL